MLYFSDYFRNWVVDVESSRDRGGLQVAPPPLDEPRLQEAIAQLRAYEQNFDSLAGQSGSQNQGASTPTTQPNPDPVGASFLGAEESRRFLRTLAPVSGFKAFVRRTEGGGFKK